jgi:hypothetical protein
VRSPWLKHLKGVKVEARATLIDAEGALGAAAGEVLFTETGLSGPPILDLSRAAGARTRAGLKTTLSLDLCPELAGDAIAQVVGARFAARGDDPAELALVGFLHKRLIAPLLRDAGVPDPAQPASGLGASRIAAVAARLKDWRFEVTGTDAWRDAQVTAGGVDTAEVDPATLASLRAPGLHLAGEVLDVDGDCGGFNLQWAWSSGHLAGSEAARRAASPRSP